MIIFNYVVNYIDIILAAILLIFIIIGYCRGLIINVINFIRWSVGTSLCFYVSEKATPSVYNSYVKPRALETINKTIVTSTNLDEVLKNLQDFSQKIPKPLADSVDFSKLNISSDDIANEILKNYFEGILMFAVKAVLFVLVFAVFFLLTGIIIMIIRRRRRKEQNRGKKTALRVTDRMLGGVLGIFKGAVAVFAVASVLVLILSLYDDEAQMSGFMKEVNNSQLLKLIDSINPFNAITGGLL